MSDQPDPESLPILSYRTDANTDRRAVRVARFSTEIQAQFVANLLERAGIPAFVFNADGSGVTAAFGLTPVELHVRPEDEPQASAILHDMAAGRIPIVEDAEPPDAAAADDDPEEDDDPRCPKCRSWQVRPRQSFRQDLLRLLRLIPRPAPGVTDFECLRCGHAWVDLAQERTRADRRAGSESDSKDPTERQ